MVHGQRQGILDEAQRSFLADVREERLLLELDQNVIHQELLKWWDMLRYSSKRTRDADARQLDDEASRLNSSVHDAHVPSSSSSLGV